MRRVIGRGFLVLGILAACGSKSGALAALTAAPARTTGAKTAKVSQQIAITPRAGQEGLPAEVKGEGTLDFHGHRGDITFTLAGQPVRSVLDGPTIYEHVPQLGSLTGGKPWVKLDLGMLASSAGISGLDSIFQGQSNDPAAGVQYLLGASGKVTTVGPARVRGERTTHYRAVVDMDKAADRAPAVQRDAIRQVSDRFGIKSVPVEAWLDGDGRVRRLLHTIDYSRVEAIPNLPSSLLPKKVDVTVELYDFGLPVSITLPPPEEVADAKQFLSGGQGGAGPAGSGSGTASPATDALQSRLIQSVPTGYVQQADDVADTGPSDLDKAVRDELEPDARTALTAAGFVAGYQRYWADPKGGAIVEFVYQFRDETAATGYLERWVDGATDPTAGPTNPFIVPEVPGARGLSTSTSEGPAAIVLLSRGAYTAQVVVHGADAATPELAMQLAKQQYDRLGA